MTIPDPERPTEPDEPVDPESRPVPERIVGASAEDHAPDDSDPEAVVDDEDAG